MRESQSPNMHDKINDWCGALFGTGLSATLGVITLERVTDTIILTAIGAAVSGLIGGTVGFYTSRCLRRQHNRKD